MENFENKKQLTRFLIKTRIRRSGETNISESQVESLDGMMLAGMPESTIVAIIELYAKLNKKGIPDNKIFQQFESMRPGSGQLPNPLTISSYIKYRLRIEHNQANLSNEFVSKAIKICCNYYNCEAKNTDVSQSTKKGNKVETTYQESNIDTNKKKSTVGKSASGAIFDTIGIIFGFIAPFILAGMVAGATDSGTAAVITFVISLAGYFVWMENKD